jgi:hypothetical protein
MLEFENPKDANLADRCIRPLCFGAPGDEHYGLSMLEFEAGSSRLRWRNMQLGLQGSCTLILYKSRYFALFTRHQIAALPNESLEELRTRMELLFVLMDNGRDSTNLPINHVILNGIVENDEDDVVIAVVEEAMITAFMRAQFFPVKRTFNGRVSDQAICAGFPSRFQRVLMKKGGLSVVPDSKTGVVSRRSSRSTGTVEYKDDGLPMDGMSGGAVFLFRLNPNPKLGAIFIGFIDGIIQRAGSGYLHYLTMERVLDKIDESVFQAEPA